MIEGIASRAMLIIQVSFVVFVFSHVLLMPKFLKTLKAHNSSAYEMLNVAWFNVFQNFTVARMLLFLVKKEYMRYPSDMHRVGNALLYSWAIPLLLLSLSLLSMLALWLITGVRLDEL